MSDPQDHPNLRPIPRATAERVWRRAIELQEERGEIVSPETLLHVARELEVDPVYVEIAMEEVRRADEEAAGGRAVGEVSAPRPADGRSGSPGVRHIERRSSHLPPGDWWTESPGALLRGRGARVAFGSAVLLAGGALVAGAGLAAALFVAVIAGVLVLDMRAVAKARSRRSR